MRLALFFLIISFCSCNKQVVHNNELVGKWKRTQIWVNPGNGGIWKNDESNPAVFVQFTSEGRIISNDNFYATYQFYKILSSNAIELSSVTTTVPPRIVGYEFISKSELKITFACIEGCGDVFVRQ